MATVTLLKEDLYKFQLSTWNRFCYGQKSVSSFQYLHSDNHIHRLYVSSFIYLFGTGSTTHLQPSTMNLWQNCIKVVQWMFLSKWVLWFQWKNKSSNWCTLDTIRAMLPSQRTNDIWLIKDKKWEEKWWLHILTFHNDLFYVLHLW